MNYYALDEALEYIEYLNEDGNESLDGKKMLEELKQNGKTFGITLAIAAALCLGGYGVYKVIDAVKSRKESSKKKKESESYSKEDQEKVYQLEDEISNAIIKHLKEYDSKNLKSKYKDNISYKKCFILEKYEEGGVEISKEQNGIAWSEWAKWEKENQNKMSESELKAEGERLFGNKWYYELLKEGEDFGKQYCKDKGYTRCKIDTGDGDEGVIYVEAHI